ncbi:head fiber protein [Salmonella phage 21]|nr:head fiber protein [Salmonella phage 21]
MYCTAYRATGANPFKTTGLVLFTTFLLCIRYLTGRMK